MDEQWRDIEGYGGRYQVSNLGNVRSIPYVRYQKSRHPGVMMYKHHSGKMITKTDNGNGYLIVCLRYKSKRKNYYVHRLVADAFVPNPNKLSEVNHKDFDKRNNAASNLEWVTRSENVQWSKERMRHPCKNAPKTKIGMRYISIRNGKYRVSIRISRLGYQFDRRFATIEEAIEARERFMSGKEYFARGS